MSYFLSGIPLQTGQSFEFAGDEARHLMLSRRTKPGDCFALQDPAGLRFEAEVIRMERKQALVRVLAPLPIPPLPDAVVTLLQAAVKEKAAEWIIQKATELGVRHLLFFPAERSTVAHKTLSAPKTHQRWEKIAWEACKQSDRHLPPEILLAEDLSQALAHPLNAKANKMLLDAGGDVALGEACGGANSARQDAPDIDGKSPNTAHTLLVGPEGGLTSEEKALAQEAGYRLARLGETVLRAETAAIAACTVAMYR